MMNFIDAVGNMLAGQRMLRSDWTGYAISILPGQSYIWSLPNKGSSPFINAAIYIPSIEDIQALDWIIKK